VKRGLVLIASLALVLCAAPAEAKKKQKKPKPLGPVVTATATGATVSATGALSTATARCPGRLQAVGGGFSAPFGMGGDLVVLDSFRSDRGAWTAEGAPVLAMGPAAITGFAYCRRDSRKVVDVAATGQVPPSSPASGTAIAGCPPRTRLIGGGFQSTRGPGPSDRPILSASISNAPQSWTVSGFNNTIEPQTLTAHAYCMRRIGAPQVLNATVSMDPSQFSSVSAATTACAPPRKPKGKGKKRKPARLLSAGGFSSPPPQGVSAVPVYTDSRISGSGWLAAAVDLGGDPGPVAVSSQGFCF
jgi:hypothetical protein